ncbi:hypothetical protein AB4Y32_06695 [Paraburkholderia phymatum]|uniref:Uncharacterized protein n=1 Tax=Paraburkholderia phymatum TaxID=148447 RepID=A0ACC6TW17_9BURK
MPLQNAALRVAGVNLEAVASAMPDGQVNGSANRAVTRHSRDTDVLLGGVGYRF